MGRGAVEVERVATRPLVIIGVDPGKRTGVACYVTGHGLPYRAELAAEDATDKVAEWLTSRIFDGTHVVIAIERFQIGTATTKKSRQYDALFVRGQLQRLARNLHLNVRHVNQSDSKRVARDTLLKKLGWHHESVHVNDAERIVLTALARERPTEFAEVIGL